LGKSISLRKNNKQPIGCDDQLVFVELYGELSKEMFGGKFSGGGSRGEGGNFSLEMSGDVQEGVVWGTCPALHVGLQDSTCSGYDWATEVNILGVHRQTDRHILTGHEPAELKIVPHLLFELCSSYIYGPVGPYTFW